MEFRNIRLASTNIHSRWECQKPTLCLATSVRQTNKNVTHLALPCLSFYLFFEKTNPLSKKDITLWPDTQFRVGVSI